jgi:Na+-transporting methylmalonyl-CoA/oxaloacetate decarboxylase gamma subunit
MALLLLFVICIIFPVAGVVLLLLWAFAGVMSLLSAVVESILHTRFLVDEARSPRMARRATIRVPSIKGTKLQPILNVVVHELARLIMILCVCSVIAITIAIVYVRVFS